MAAAAPAPAAAPASSSSLPSPSSSSSSFPRAERFHVELKDGETTFVSWRKLQKESSRLRHGSSASSLLPPLGAHPALEARFAPSEADNPPKRPDLLAKGGKEKDVLPPPPNRFNSMIERIERLYQGGNSDDGSSDFLDDDKYDTRDSFIDDSELNDYFSVENAKLKHDGFFINRGSLQEEPESCSVAVHKKRKKDVKKLDEASNQDNKKKLNGVARTKNKICPPSAMSRPSDANDGNICHKPSDSAMKTSDGKELLGVLKVKSTVDQLCDSGINMRGVKLLDINEPLENDSLPMEHKNMSMKVCKPTAVQKVTKEDSFKETMKSPSTVGREISPSHAKGTSLEKAFLELEKGVAELCPPALVARDPEQGKRNRLPLDIKQKLTKVARLAAKQGRIADELIERLMGILGHMVRVKTLKRNLKAMIEMGLSAIREKEGRLQGIKKEVIEMIGSRVRSLQAQDAGKPEDFQVSGTSKANGDGRYNWDHATEDKICALYEQYIEGMDENKGPHLRKLYAELVELWPDGWMDDIGIKHALRRARNRKRRLKKASNNGEGMRRRPALKPKLESSDTHGEFLLQSNNALVLDGSQSGKTNRGSTEQGSKFIDHKQRLINEDNKHVSDPGSVSKSQKLIDGRLPQAKNTLNREMDRSGSGTKMKREASTGNTNGVVLAGKGGVARADNTVFVMADKSGVARSDKSSISVANERATAKTVTMCSEREPIASKDKKRVAASSDVVNAAVKEPISVNISKRFLMHGESSGAAAVPIPAMVQHSYNVSMGHL